ncbi:MAG: hypothetical protein ACODUE_05180 [Synechococcus sp.]
MRAKLFRIGRSQDVRPSVRDLLAERDRLLAEPGVREELDAFFDNLRDPSPPPERDWP